MCMDLNLIWAHVSSVGMLLNLTQLIVDVNHHNIIRTLTY